MRLGDDCPVAWEDVATELILHSQYSWSEIASRLGVTRGQLAILVRADQVLLPGGLLRISGEVVQGQRA
jgi:hypothetical protein